MLEELKEEVLRANLSLYESGVVIFTWGNVSGRSEDGKYMVIKPSGVPYAQLTREDMVVIDLASGEAAEGSRNPSSDTKTHRELYLAFPELKGITHTHSTNAVAFAQAGRPIPALGTTHADAFFGEVPCTRGLTEEEVRGDYEKNTGLVIAETLRAAKISPMDVPAILVRNHGPFTWGASAGESAHNAIVLETVADMALKTLYLNEKSDMPFCLSEKHYRRKHGPDAYYGQK